METQLIVAQLDTKYLIDTLVELARVPTDGPLGSRDTVNPWQRTMLVRAWVNAILTGSLRACSPQHKCKPPYLDRRHSHRDHRTAQR
jgi:hypothetical protein